MLVSRAGSKGSREKKGISDRAFLWCGEVTGRFSTGHGLVQWGNGCPAPALSHPRAEKSTRTGQSETSACALLGLPRKRILFLEDNTDLIQATFT